MLKAHKMKNLQVTVCVILSQLAACGPTPQEVNGRAEFKFTELGMVFDRIGNCPATWPDQGRSSVLPPMDVACHQGPRKQCVLTDNPQKPWEYSDAT